MRESTPFILSTGATPISRVIPTDNAPAPLPVKDLVNSLTVPVEIMELCFAIDEQSDTTFILATQMTLAMAGAEIDLRCGRYSLTNGFVPIAALGINRHFEQAEIGRLDFVAGVDGPIDADFIRWILPRPFVVMPGEAFTGAVRLSPALSFAALPASTVRVSITARGRRMPSGARVGRRFVPYASGRWFTTDSINVSQGDGKTYMNIMNTPLVVTSLNARARRLFDAPLPDFTIVSPGGLANTVRRDMANQSGALGLFMQRLALEETFVLDPGEFLTVRSGAIATSTALNMVGYREEE